MGGVGRRGRDRQPLVINCVKSGSKEINRYTARLQVPLTPALTPSPAPAPTPTPTPTPTLALPLPRFAARTP